jgi:hypothetical protein
VNASAWWAPSVAHWLLLGLLVEAVLFALWRHVAHLTTHWSRRSFTVVALALGIVFLGLGAGVTLSLSVFEVVMLLAMGLSVARNRGLDPRIARVRVGVLVVFFGLGLWNGRPAHRDLSELITTATTVVPLHLSSERWLFEELRRRPDALPALEASFGQASESRLELHAMLGGQPEARARACKELAPHPRLPPGICPGS